MHVSSYTCSFNLEDLFMAPASPLWFLLGFTFLCSRVSRGTANLIITPLQIVCAGKNSCTCASKTMAPSMMSSSIVTQL